MRRSTLPFAPTKTYDPISIDLKEKRKKVKNKNSLSPLALPLSLPPFDFVFLLFIFFYFYYYYFLFLIFLFFYFIFPIISSIRHLVQCESFIQVHHMSCHVIPDVSKNVKFRLSWNPMKFDGVTRFRKTNSTVKSVSSSEIYKIFGFQPKLPFYPFSEKLNFSRVFYSSSLNRILSPKFTHTGTHKHNTSPVEHIRTQKQSMYIMPCSTPMPINLRYLYT